MKVKECYSMQSLSFSKKIAYNLLTADHELAGRMGPCRCHGGSVFGLTMFSLPTNDLCEGTGVDSRCLTWSCSADLSNRV